MFLKLTNTRNSLLLVSGNPQLKEKKRHQAERGVQVTFKAYTG